MNLGSCYFIMWYQLWILDPGFRFQPHHLQRHIPDALQISPLGECAHLPPPVTERVKLAPCPCAFFLCWKDSSKKCFVVKYLLNTIYVWWPLMIWETSWSDTHYGTLIGARVICCLCSMITRCPEIQWLSKILRWKSEINWRAFVCLTVIYVMKTY